MLYEVITVAIDTNRKVNAELHQKLPKSGISIADYAKQNGIEIIELTDAERASFREAMRPVWDKYREKIGGDLFDFVLAKIEQHKNRITSYNVCYTKLLRTRINQDAARTVSRPNTDTLSLGINRYPLTGFRT